MYGVYVVVVYGVIVLYCTVSACPLCVYLCVLCMRV